MDRVRRERAQKKFVGRQVKLDSVYKTHAKRVLLLLFPAICLVGVFFQLYVANNVLNTPLSGSTLQVMRRPNPSGTPWNISVIIPTCNRLHSLQDAIDSVLNQTYPILEIIVAIDNGKGCVKQLRNIWKEKGYPGNTPVHFINVPPCEIENDPSKESFCGGKAGRARNFAIQHASPFTTHYAFLDDDDLWFPRKTELQVKEMIQQNHVPFSSTDAYFPQSIQEFEHERFLSTQQLGPDFKFPHTDRRCVRKSEDDIGTYRPHDLSNESAFIEWNGKKMREYVLRRKLEMQDFPTHVTADMLRKHNFFMTSSVVIAKEEFPGFNDTAKNGQEDRDAWIRALDSMDGVPALYIPQPWIVYDQHRSKCNIPRTSALYFP